MTANEQDSQNKIEIDKILASITNKRARVVILHIQKNGQITSEDIQKYGYHHPPRAIRDVREAGIPLVTTRVLSTDGRHIAAYKFGDLSEINQGKLAGRKTFSKQLRNLLFEEQNHRCAICDTKYEERYLQVDHRIPYEVAGEVFGMEDHLFFMMLCSSCNRAKSWSCERCINWQTEKDLEICNTCYWAHPEHYLHIAMNSERRVELTWAGDEVKDFERVSDQAKKLNFTINQFIKKIVSNFLK